MPELQVTENAPVNFEAGVVLEHKDLISIGFGYNYQQSFTFLRD